LLCNLLYFNQKCERKKCIKIQQSFLLNTISIKPPISCSKSKFRTLTAEIQRKTPLIDISEFRHQRKLPLVLLLLIYSNRVITSSWPSPKHANVIPRIHCRIDIGCNIDILGPINALDLGAFVEIPDLNLVFGWIAPSEDASILEIQWLPWDVGPIEVLDTFALPCVPDVDHWVPTTGDQGGLVNEF
jgi:hypothetical protein